MCVRADSRVIGFGVEGFRVRAFGLRLDASTLNGKGIDFRKVCVCVRSSDRLSDCLLLVMYGL